MSIDMCNAGSALSSSNNKCKSKTFIGQELWAPLSARGTQNLTLNC